MKSYDKWKLYFLFLTIALIITGLVSPEYELDLIATALVYGLFAASVDFSYGYVGILNLGSALYFGIGAYIMAYGLKKGMDPVLLVVAGVLLSGVIVSVVSYIGFRVKASQIHFGLIGLAITLGFEQLAISLYSLTGGSNGITLVPRPVFNLLGVKFPLTSPTTYYFFVVLFVMAVLFCLWKVVNSDFGMAMRALRHDETKLETMGYNPLLIKMTVSAITATISAFTGALFVPIVGIAYPSLFGVGLSMAVLIWVALGGTGTLIGPFVIAGLLKMTESTLSSSFQETYTLILGFVFVLMVIVAPEGLFGLLKRLISYYKSKDNATKEGDGYANY